MSNEKVIINFIHFAEADLNELASTVVKNCTGNVNFTFTGGALVNVTAAATTFSSKLSAVPTGTPQAVVEKDIAKKVLTDALHILALQVNLLANNDKAKLESSGIPLVAKGSTQVMPIPTGLQVKLSDVSGSVNISVDVPNVSHHGTLFAYTLAANAPANPEEWKLKHANGHSFTLSGLTPGSNYQFTAAYKGNDAEDLIWCPAITKMVV